MSGGYYDYKYNDLMHTYEHEFEDIELNLMFKDFVELLQKLEWYKSGDTNKNDYKKAVKEFKRKWFKRTEIDVKKMIQDEITKLEHKLLEDLKY